MERQRAVRTEQTEEVDADVARRLRPARPKLRDRRGRKRQRRRLPEPHRLVARARGAADPRLVRVQALELAQRREEAEAMRRFAERAELIYSTCRCPRRGDHRITSPRSVARSTVCVNELIETYFAKKRSST